jgi:hypothetical protein
MPSDTPKQRLDPGTRAENFRSDGEWRKELRIVSRDTIAAIVAIGTIANADTEAPFRKAILLVSDSKCSKTSGISFAFGGRKNVSMMHPAPFCDQSIALPESEFRAIELMQWLPSFPILPL